MRDEDAERRGEHGDQQALDQPVEVARGDVDDQVAPGEGQGDEDVEEGEHGDDGHVVLVLDHDEDAADVVAEEVAGHAEQGHDEEEPEATREAGVEPAASGAAAAAAGELRGGRGAGATASATVVRVVAIGGAASGLALVGVDHDDAGRHLKGGEICAPVTFPICWRIVISSLFSSSLVGKCKYGYFEELHESGRMFHGSLTRTSV